MSEARRRGLTQSQSNIFSGSPTTNNKRRDVPQTQSKIFEPLEVTSKPMTYAREKYQQTSIHLGNDPDPYREEQTYYAQDNCSPAGKRIQQNSTTKYLLGNDRSTFFKKSVNEHYGVPKDFEPKYANDTAFERKQKELYNGFSPSKEEESPSKIENENYNARDRKYQDRVSIFDTNNYKPRADSPKENTKPPMYNPNMRKNEILSSNVFGERTVQDYNNKPPQARENDSERRKNHLYSDLFGANNNMKSERPSEKPSERLQAASHFLSTMSKPNPNYDPREQIYKNLESSIEIGDSPPRAPRNRPQTPQNSYTPRYQDSFPNAAQMKQQELSTGYQDGSSKKPELYDLEMNSVPSKYSASEIKEFCEGVHVVSLVLDIDNFTGTCKGTGRIKVRTTDPKDISKIEGSLKRKGIKTKPFMENLGKKTNYSDISSVNWHDPYEYKRTTTPGNARETKMKNLESSVFEGQHKWVDRKVESVDSELLAQMQWKNTKTAARPLY